MKLVELLNNSKLIPSLMTLVRIIGRSYNSTHLERIQSLLKQSLANGKIDLTPEERQTIILQAKLILDEVAKKKGYKDWFDLKIKTPR